MKPGKRSGPPNQSAAKRRKTTPAVKAKGARKEKAFDRPLIPIPNAQNESDGESNLSEQDLEILQDFGAGAQFLKQLDQKGIARSKKETDRLHQLHKPIRQKESTLSLPSIHSDSEDDAEAWDSNVDNDELDSDAEMAYEAAPRVGRDFEEKKAPGVQRLPIKLKDGTVQDMGRNLEGKVESESEEDESDDEEPQQPLPPARHVEDVSTGARFGRAAVVDVITRPSRKARIQEAKEQIASICQDIVAEPEMSLGLLRRLHAFASASVTSPAHPQPIKNDVLIRKLAIISQLTVLLDVMPGYRIRPLTDLEKAEKVSQEVSRIREWEQGLVGVYQAYLRILETEWKAKNELSDTALQCLCTLASKATHFNFMVNIMSSVVGSLSRKSWDHNSEISLDAIKSVFRADLTGQPSLEVVRLLNRMIKERKYRIHPNVLTCLPYLRLKTELSVRASDTKTDRPPPQKKGGKRAKGAPRRKIGDAPHVSKKNAKLLKEQKEIDKELREAEAEVDMEQRKSTQTETLKLLFVLYFSILKSEQPTTLLPNALEGIARFSHLVNVDFFKDLLKVLKKLIEDEDEDEDIAAATYRRLMCIITAFDLLSGQGEALNIDLTDFVNHLYAIIRPLSFATDIDRDMPAQGGGRSSIADKLFRALEIVFNPRTVGSAAPAWRSAAFAKRLLTASLHWPPALVNKTLEFVDGLILKDEKLEAMLFTEERSMDGVYRPEIDDPQACNPFGTSFWELFALRNGHFDSTVRESAAYIIQRTQDSNK